MSKTADNLENALRVARKREQKVWGSGDDHQKARAEVERIEELAISMGLGVAVGVENHGLDAEHDRPDNPNPKDTMTTTQVMLFDDIENSIYNLATLEQKILHGDLADTYRYVERCRMLLDRIELILEDYTNESKDTTKEV